MANRAHGNILLRLTALLFVVLGIQQLVKALAPLLGG